MNLSSEPVLSDNARRTLESRYLKKDPSGKTVETPGELFARVARAAAGAEKNFGVSRHQINQVRQGFYEIMSQTRFLPNSPTLMNAERRPGVLSACFVLPVDDSIEGIFDSVKHTARIQQAGGGTGFSFDRLRPTGDYIASSGGRTSGPISFWRVFSEATRAIQQGAFRRGANMGMMSAWHPDILKFIVAKEDLSAFENFNISIKISDLFMQNLRRNPDAPHEVINPRTGEKYFIPHGVDVRRYTLSDLAPAGQSRTGGDVYTIAEVWRMITSAARETAEPGLCFIDRVNADNPTPLLGRIEATNPCGEQPLLDYEACNLGSIDISKYVTPDGLDEDSLRETIRLGVRFLDDVIEVNNYIIPPIERMCKGNRKIGLGIMGLADAMFTLGVKYDSKEGLAFGQKVAQLFTDEAFGASESLAQQRGTFRNYAGSVWEKRGRKMRNAAVTTVAPTGTLSILAGCTGGIEPAFALAFHRHVLDGQRLLEVNGPFRRHAERSGFWSEELGGKLAAGDTLEHLGCGDERTRRVFVTARQIAPSWHVRMQAAFQKYIDGAISKTINMPNSASVRDVEEIYNLAYDTGCKGITVYRDGCRSRQPMSHDAGTRPCPHCSRPVQDEPGCSRCPHCGCTLCS